MAYTWKVATKVLFGAGKLKELHKEALPGKKALVVISNGKSTRLNGSLATLEGVLFDFDPIPLSDDDVVKIFDESYR